MHSKWLTPLLLVVLTWVAPCRADDKAEAKKHFQAGVTLIKAEDFAGAAAAFENSVRLFPTRTSLFNLANCYKALQRYGEALATVRRLEREFGDKLGPELEAEARTFSASIENLVGRLGIDARPAGTAITVDGRPVGRSPLGEDVLLGPGDHEVELSLEGFEPVRRTVRVESRGKVAISVGLEREKGQLRISTETVGARVLLDGVAVGRTPLDSPLAAAPGPHRVRLELEGYGPVERAVEVAPGQQAVLFLSLVEVVAEGPPALRKPEREPAFEEAGAPDAVPEDAGGRGAGAWRFVGLGLTLAAGAATGVFYGLAIESSSDFESARKEYDTVQSQLDGDGYSSALEERGLAAWEEMEDARAATDRFQKLGLGFGIATGALAVATVVLFAAGGGGGDEAATVSAAPGGLSVAF
jgi:tetratricopeptide (TPR) repeat protein